MNRKRRSDTCQPFFADRGLRTLKIVDFVTKNSKIMVDFIQIHILMMLKNMHGIIQWQELSCMLFQALFMKLEPE